MHEENQRLKNNRDETARKMHSLKEEYASLKEELNSFSPEKRFDPSVTEGIDSRLHDHGHCDQFRQPDFEEPRVAAPQPSSAPSSRSLRAPAASSAAFSLAPSLAATSATSATGEGEGSSLSAGGGGQSVSVHAQPQTEEGETADVELEGEDEAPATTEARSGVDSAVIDLTEVDEGDDDDISVSSSNLEITGAPLTDRRTSTCSSVDFEADHHDQGIDSLIDHPREGTPGPIVSRLSQSSSLDLDQDQKGVRVPARREESNVAAPSPALHHRSSEAASDTAGGQEDAAAQLGHEERPFSSEVRRGHADFVLWLCRKVSIDCRREPSLHSTAACAIAQTVGCKHRECESCSALTLSPDQLEAVSN